MYLMKADAKILNASQQNPATYKKDLFTMTNWDFSHEFKVGSTYNN